MPTTPQQTASVRVVVESATAAVVVSTVAMALEADGRRWGWAFERRVSKLERRAGVYFLGEWPVPFGILDRRTRDGLH